MTRVVELLDTTVRDELRRSPGGHEGALSPNCRFDPGYGLERMREPHVKHLEGPLWEMRIKGRDGVSRAIYVTAKGRRVVVVRVFVKKTRNTPRREIDLALGRAKEVIQ